MDGKGTKTSLKEKRMGRVGQRLIEQETTEHNDTSQQQQQMREQICPPLTLSSHNLIINTSKILLDPLKSSPSAPAIVDPSSTVRPENLPHVVEAMFKPVLRQLAAIETAARVRAIEEEAEEEEEARGAACQRDNR